MRALVVAIVFFFMPVSVMADRAALVIGNGAYKHVTPLDNPANDAEAVSDALKDQGFDVMMATDLTLVEIYRTLRKFREMADRSEVAMIYYAGHGIEIGGQNYLIPVDARLSDERDADTEMINMDVLLRQLSGAKKLKMVVLDACRDNPFVNKMQREGTTRNIGRGLAVVSRAEAATLIAYAAAAGEVTPDGERGRNSPFTRAFLNALAQPPADVRIILGAARDELSKLVPGAVPFVYSSLGSERIIINPNSQVPEAEPEPEPVEIAAKPAFDEDALLRDFAKSEFAGTIEAWDAFLNKYEEYPSHMLYVLAIRARKQLSAQVRPVAAPSPSRPKTETLQPQVADTAQETVAVRTARAETPSQGPEMRASPRLDVPTDKPVIPNLAILSKDEATREIQAILKERRCYSGRIDGIWGRGSRAGLSGLNEILGTQMTVSTRPNKQELNRVLDMLRGAPKGDCPVVARQAPAKPTKRRKTTKRTTTSQPKAAAPPPAPAAPKKKAKKSSNSGICYAYIPGSNCY